MFDIIPICNDFELSLFCQKAAHISGKTVQYPHAHIFAVILDIAVRRHIIEMFRSRYLRHIFSGNIDLPFFHQLNKAV